MRHNQGVKPVRVTVSDRLYLTPLPGEAEDRLKGYCTHSNPEYHKARAMGLRWTKEPPTIVSWGYRAGMLSLPRGRTQEVRTVLGECGVPFEFVDQRTDGDPTLANRIPDHRLTLWDHQARVVEAVLDIEQGLIRAPTASGKTSAGLAAISAAQLPSLVLVWNAKLLGQWVDRAVDELGLREDEIGKVGDGVTRWRPLTVAMQQTLARSPEKLATAAARFGFVLCDEVQRFAATSFTGVINAFSARYRIGLSADESRKDRKEFLIYDQFGRVIADIDRRELEKKELVLPVDLLVVPTEFDAPWYFGDEDSDRKETPDFNRLLEEMTHNDARNALIGEWIGRVPGVKLVLTHRREHALAFQECAVAGGQACGLLVGTKENAEEFDIVVEALRAKRLGLAVGTYQAIGVGIDIKPVQVGVCLTPIHSNRQFFGQVRGRVCRAMAGKTSASLLYFWDRKVFGDHSLKKLARMNDRRVKVWDGYGWVEVDSYLERQ